MQQGSKKVTFDPKTMRNFEIYFILKYDRDTYNKVMQFHNWVIKEGFTFEDVEEMFSYIKQSQRKREMIENER